MGQMRHFYPYSTRNRVEFLPMDDYSGTMASIELFDELLDRLQRTTDLGRGQAAKVVADVLGAFGETTEEFIRRRHRELHGDGLRNEQIYPRIAIELSTWRVRPPMLSQRQIRRAVYR